MRRGSCKSSISRWPFASFYRNKIAVGVRFRREVAACVSGLCQNGLPTWAHVASRHLPRLFVPTASVSGGKTPTWIDNFLPSQSPAALRPRFWFPAPETRRLGRTARRLRPVESNCVHTVVCRPCAAAAASKAAWHVGSGSKAGRVNY